MNIHRSKTKSRLSEKISKKLYRVEYQRNSGYAWKGIVESYLKKSAPQFVSAFRNPCLPKANVTIKGFSDTAVVFQGPISKENNFTLNTVRFFREIYPNILLILSTYKDELNDSEKKLLELYKCKLIESYDYPPEDKGKGQKKSYLRNQLFSSLQGVKLAKSCDCKYILKIRTDLRINKQDFISYFMNLLQTFPCNNKTQNARLICVAFSNNLVNIPFHMSDFIWFGQIDDMKKVYDIPYWSNEDLDYIRTKTSQKEFMQKYERLFYLLRTHCYYDVTPQKELSFIDERFLTLYHEELYIAYNAAKAFGAVEKGKPLIENYRNFIRNSLIIIDDRNIDTYWNKYNHNLLEQGRSLSDKGKLTSTVWFDLYCKGNKNV